MKIVERMSLLQKSGLSHAEKSVILRLAVLSEQGLGVSLQEFIDFPWDQSLNIEEDLIVALGSLIDKGLIQVISESNTEYKLITNADALFKP